MYLICFIFSHLLFLFKFIYFSLEDNCFIILYLFFASFICFISKSLNLWFFWCYYWFLCCCYFLKYQVYTDLTEVALVVKNLPVMEILQETQEMQSWFLVWEDPPEKEMATHSGIPAWRIPWTEEPGRLQSMGLERVRHDWAANNLWIWN